MPLRHDALPVGPGSTIEFILLYGVLAAMALGVANFIASVVVTWVDRRVVALAPPTRRSATRADELVHRRYTIGFLPIEDEILAVAYLRGGAPKVAETLLAWAKREGWVLRAEDDRWVLKRLPKAAPAWAASLTRPLAVGTITGDVLERAADATARHLEPRLAIDLVRAGFLRSGAARGAGGLSLVAASAWVVVIGAMRVARAPELGEPTWLLAGEVATVALAAAGLAAMIGRRTDTADAWLAWLDTATTALQRDHALRRTLRPDEVALVTALS